jgi:hypothetical protein
VTARGDNPVVRAKVKFAAARRRLLRNLDSHGTANFPGERHTPAGYARSGASAAHRSVGRRSTVPGQRTGSGSFVRRPKSLGLPPAIRA